MITLVRKDGKTSTVTNLGTRIKAVKDSISNELSMISSLCLTRPIIPGECNCQHADDKVTNSNVLQMRCAVNKRIADKSSQLQMSAT